MKLLSPLIAGFFAAIAAAGWAALTTHTQPATNKQATEWRTNRYTLPDDPQQRTNTVRALEASLITNQVTVGTNWHYFSTNPIPSYRWRWTSDYDLYIAGYPPATNALKIQFLGTNTLWITNAAVLTNTTLK